MSQSFINIQLMPVRPQPPYVNYMWKHEGGRFWSSPVPERSLSDLHTDVLDVPEEPV